jgi:hypothetical protein
MKTKLILFLCTAVTTNMVFAMQQNKPTEKNLTTSPQNPTKKQTEPRSYPLKVGDEKAQFSVHEWPNDPNFVPVFIPIDLEQNKEIIALALQEHFASK